MLHEKVLVPLDGSAFSDQTLAQIGPLLRDPAAQVRLLTVVDEHPFRSTLRPLRGAQDDELSRRASERARAHLGQVQERLAGEGIEATTVVRKGTPAEGILDEIAEYEPTLVAMTTRGRSGLAKWVYGSVAQRIVRHCAAPLLLLRPGEEPRELALRRVLVALDGSERAAKVLPLVEALARLHGAEVVLFSAGWATDVDSGVAYDREIRTSEEELQAMHEAHVERLRGAGLKTRSRVVWGTPAEEIAAAVEQEEADLLALTTHGRTGFERFLLGSVAENALRSCRVPVLLLRTPGR